MSFGCWTILSSTNVILDASPFSLSGKSTITEGYSETFCLQCTITKTWDSSQIIFNKDSINIIQHGDCSTALTAKSISSPFSYSFLSSGLGKTYDIDTFFTQNTLQFGCSLACSLGDSCGSSQTGPNVILSSVIQPWTITALENVIIGYDKTSCLRCTSGSTNFDQTFKNIQIGDCSSTLTPKSILTPLSDHIYSSSGAGKTYNIDTFFTQNTLPQGCTLSCSLGDSCGDILTGINVIQQNLNSPWTILAEENQVMGYDETKCLRCISGLTNFDQTFQIIQQDNCMAAMTPKSLQISLILPFVSSGLGKTYDVDTFFTQNALLLGCTRSCSIGDTCGGSLSGIEIIQSSFSTPWTITALENQYLGYIKIACFRCISGATIFDQPIMIEQEPDCTLNEITVPSPFTQIPYSSTGLGQTFDHTDFFSPGILATKCSLSCTVGDTCGGSLTGDEITESPSSPWEINAKETAILGYNKQVCYRCNSLGVDYDLILTIVQMGGCITVLTPIIISNPLSDHIYINGGDTGKSFDISTFFIQNVIPEGCSLSCSLTDSPCGTPLTGTNVIQTIEASPWTINAKDNVTSGYLKDACYRCTSQVYNFDQGFQIIQQQQPDCSGILINKIVDSPFTILPYQSDSQGYNFDLNSFYAKKTIDQCLIDKCELFDSTCSSRYSGLFVNQQSSIIDPFTITASQIVQDGYEEELCLFCVASDKSVFKTTFKIAQTLQPSSSDCLKPKSVVDVIILKYDKQQTKILNTKDFFVIPDEQCKIEKCSILNGPGCQTKFQGFEININKQSPEILVLSQRYPRGYQLQICVQCSNSLLSSISNTFTVIQDIINCKNTLKPENFSNQVIKFDMVNSANFPISNFFKIEEPNCPLTSCELKEAMCEEIYDRKNIKLISENPISLKVSADQPQGYTDIVCVQCSNGIETITVDNWKVTQNPHIINCSQALKLVKIKDNRIEKKFNLYKDYEMTMKELIYNSMANQICNPFTCVLKNPGCGKLHNSTRIDLRKQKEQWIMTMNRNVYDGYNETFCVSCDNIFQTKEYDNLSFYQIPDPNSKKFPLSGWIKSITQLGDVEIMFDKEMNTNFNATLLLNQTNIDMWVIPFNDWHLEIQDFNISKLNFTWNCSGFSNKTLNFKLIFNNAIDISPLISQDKLFINLTNAVQLGYFRSFDGLDLRKQDQEMKFNIKKQIVNNDFNKNFVQSVNQVGSGSSGVLIGTLLLNFVLAGAFTYMIQWIHSMQMIVHLPMMRILVPGNVQAYFQTIVPIITFDILPADYSTELILNFDRQSQEKVKDMILGQMQDLGYENHNLIQILGSLGVLQFLNLILMIIYIFILLPLHLRYPNLKWRITKLIKNQCFYHLMIVVCQGGYFEFIIGIYLNIDVQIKTESGEMASVILAFYCFLIIFIWIPSALINLLRAPLESIQNSRKFKRKWSAFYDDIKTTNRGTLAYFYIFYARRVFFCFVAFYLLPLTIIKIQIIMMINLFIVIYQASYNPFITKKKNRIELFNEVFITIITFHICLFTDFMPNQETQITMGWSMICLTVINTVLNFLIILAAGFSSMKLIIIKWYYRFRRLMNPEFMRIVNDPTPIIQVVPIEENSQVTKVKKQDKTIVSGVKQIKKVKFVPQEKNEIINNQMANEYIKQQNTPIKSPLIKIKKLDVIRENNQSIIEKSQEQSIENQKPPFIDIEKLNQRNQNQINYQNRILSQRIFRNYKTNFDYPQPPVNQYLNNPYNISDKDRIIYSDMKQRHQQYFNSLQKSNVYRR